ncbi:sentrin-specific protease 1-like [Atheta coriaria]|uniref:sentrin-specific protease 1-like n=1 Tax=Dalotia coriaria TaxID=877792 RepID=UPI0031F3BD2B
MGQLCSIFTKLTVLILSPLANQIVKEHVLECERREQDLELIQRLGQERAHALPFPIQKRQRLTVQSSEIINSFRDASTSAQLEYSLCPLNAKQEAIVAYSLDESRSLTTILACKFELTIIRRDMLTLHGNNWLNNEIINFYMKMIIERSRNALNNFPDVYCFDSSFYPKLVKDGPFSTKKWTKTVNIFHHELIFIPMHIGLHWCLICINMAEQKVVYYDSGPKSVNNCLNIIMKYLYVEYEDKQGSVLDVDNWKLESARGVPQHKHAGDCGVFVCAIAEFLSRQAPFTFTHADIPLIRKRMVVEIMIGGLLVQ